MGYNENCEVQDCPKGCCNRWGYCTEDYDYSTYDPSYTSCKYYYVDESIMDEGTLTGIVVGSILFLIIAIALGCYIKKRRDFQQLMATTEHTHNQQQNSVTDNQFTVYEHHELSRQGQKPEIGQP